ncbi:MAG: carboxypeptidase regulatory-like domain-containing protein [Myxococcota bacterium]
MTALAALARATCAPEAWPPEVASGPGSRARALDPDPEPAAAASPARAEARAPTGVTRPLAPAGPIADDASDGAPHASPGPAAAATLVVHWSGAPDPRLVARRATISTRGSATVVYYGASHPIDIVDGVPCVVAAPARWRIINEAAAPIECGTVDVEPGRRYELRCGRGYLTSIVGRVVGPDGSPAAGVTVRSAATARGGVRGPELSAVTDADGFFELDVECDRAVTRRIRFAKPGTGKAWRDVAVTPGDEIDVGTVALEPPETFGGVGTNVVARDGVARFVWVDADGPLGRAGGRSGDELIAIDGQPVAGLETATLIAMVRGEPGSVVTFEVRRGTAPMTLRVQRGLITRD